MLKPNVDIHVILFVVEEVSVTSITKGVTPFGLSIS